MEYSRHDDPTMVQCEDCGWIGKVSECIHTYKGIPNTSGDVEPVDRCPKCGSERLIELIDKGVKILTPVQGQA